MIGLLVFIRPRAAIGELGSPTLKGASTLGLCYCILFYIVFIADLGIHPSAPKVFTSPTKKVKAKLGLKGIRTIFYIDDILVLGPTFSICMDNVTVALSMLIKAGFMINWEKSSLSPKTNLKFLGMVWDSTLATLSIPQDKVDSL
jgi:hypothetical protein